VLLLVAWMNDIFSDTGVFIIAFFSGLTDVDAITVSNIRLYSLGNLSANVTVIAVVVAFVANLLFKLGVVYVVGSSDLRAPVAKGFAMLVLGAVAGLGLSLVPF
jgi:uncharacterized membrane protein (DUF4010 family)